MKNKQRGSLKWIFIIVVGIIIASFYFDFSIQEAVEDEQTQSNFAYVWNNVVTLYDSHISPIWNDVFIDLIWDSFIDNMKHIKAGELTTIDTAAPQINIPE